MRNIQRWATPVLFLALALLIYFPVETPEFLLWDDELHLFRGAFANTWTEAYQGIYAPMLYALWSWVARIAGLLVPEWRDSSFTWPFIFLNMATHLLNTALAFKLARRIAPARERLPWLAALVFLLHPLQVESVAWISGFKEQVWTTFAFLSLLAYLGDRAWWSVLSFAAAVLCKPTAVILPLLILALDRAALRRPQVWLMSAVALWASYLAKTVQPTVAINSPVGPIERVFVAVDAIGFYLAKLIWPLNLTADYGRRPALVIESGVSGYMLLGAAALLSAGVLLFQIRRGRVGLGLATSALAFFLIPLLPVLGLVPFMFQNYSTVADRYMYLPVFGFALAVAALVDRRPRPGLVPVAMVLTVWAAISHHQASHWRTNEGFFAHVLAVNPKSYMAANNLGIIAEARGDSVAALKYFEMSFTLNPRYAEGAKNFGAMLVNTGQFERAVAHFEPLIALEPRWIDFRIGYGSALMGLSRWNEAVREFELALQLDPSQAVVHAQLAIALSESGRHGEALNHFRRAVELAPKEEVYRLNLQRAEDKARGHDN